MTATLESEAREKTRTPASAAPIKESLPRVLCVDDDASILGAIGRVLSRQFEVVSALSAVAGLEIIRQGPAFAVVISDFDMPGMNGAEFLRQVRELTPDSVRLLLTGRRDLFATVAAVNHGQIYRFIAKPIAPEMLSAVVTAACDQHRLIVAEKVLLEQTLHGSIKALISLMSLVQPAALGRTGRIKRHVSGLAEQLKFADRWSLEIAALLSQIGCVTLPIATMEKFAKGEALTSDDEALITRLPLIAESLIAGIPRLEMVREILRYQNTHFDGTNSPEPILTGKAIPAGARILKAAIDFDVLESRGLTPQAALAVMVARDGVYDATILAAGVELWKGASQEEGLQEILLSQVSVGMVFATDLFAPGGMLLAARGQEVTAALVDRVQFDWSEWAAVRPISMIVRGV